MNDAAILDSNKMYAKLMEVGNGWADAKAAYTLLDSTTKSVLADLTRNQLNGGPLASKLSRVEAEMEALASPVYREHLRSVGDAFTKYLRAQVRYESLKTLVDLRRSEESTRRAELQIL